MNRIPNHYRDNKKTGLAFSGEGVNKGLYVDAYFRVCSLKQIELSRVRNQFLNGGNTYSTKDTSILAWGVCYLFSKQKITNKILDLGATK